MSMSLSEARAIALDNSHQHATVTFDLAASILERNGEPALRQLAEIKACLNRGHITTAGLIGNPKP